MIHIKKLRVAYGSAVVIRDIELEAPRGEVTALVGPNGAGKTTTLKAIMGLVKHSGVIVVDGVDISHWAANKRAKFGIGLSPETRDLFPSLTVRENLILPIKALKLNTDALELIYNIMPIIKGLLDRPANTLSGGQQKLVALARALIIGRRVLLLDEVFEGVAMKLADEITRYLREYVKTQSPAVIIAESTTHYIKNLANRIYHIDRGQILHPPT